MPELPEVQTVVNNLSSKLLKRTIIQVKSPNQYINVFYNNNLELFNNQTAQKHIEKIYRVGKYIILELNIGFIYIHLRMTGQLLFNIKSNNKYVSAKFILDNNNYLIFSDIRKFGKIYYSDNLRQLKTKLGIEPLSKDFTLSWLFKNIKLKKRMIKSLLLDQSFIVGLGNIYIDECLWKASIHPKSNSSKIPENNIIKLHTAIIMILNKAIEFQGTTIINFYFGNNSKGNYSENLYIYGRTSKNCNRCNNIIIKIYVSQRGTHICSKCQLIK